MVARYALWSLGSNISRGSSQTWLPRMTCWALFPFSTWTSRKTGRSPLSLQPWQAWFPKARSPWGPSYSWNPRMTFGSRNPWLAWGSSSSWLSNAFWSSFPRRTLWAWWAS